MAGEKQAGEKEVVPSQPKVEYIQPPNGLPSIYANNAAISPGIFDVRIFFGELMQASPDEIKILTKMEVIMSWVEAKILASFLQKQIEAFEKTNGPIKYPKQPAEPERHNPFGDDADLVHTRARKIF
jgi:hypothetical protein